MPEFDVNTFTHRDTPPIPTLPHSFAEALALLHKPTQPKIFYSPRAATETTPVMTPRLLEASLGTPTATPPTWVFPAVGGDYQIDASTNLTVWWPVAVVYSATNITIISDTVAKRPIIFYRVRLLP